jgi:hypothetical protein
MSTVLEAAIAPCDRPPPMPYIGAIVVYTPKLGPPTRGRPSVACVWRTTAEGFRVCDTIETADTIPATPEPPQPAVVYLVCGYREVCIRTLGQNSECLGRVPFQTTPTPGSWSWPGGMGQ